MKPLISVLSLLLGGIAVGSETTEMAVEANSKFAFDLYAELAKETPGKNLFFSPFSVASNSQFSLVMILNETRRLLSSVYVNS